MWVCAALLVPFSEEFLEMEFHEVVIFLQNLPTQLWTKNNMDIVLSQAYLCRTIFGVFPRRRTTEGRDLRTQHSRNAPVSATAPHFPAPRRVLDVACWS